MRAPMVQYADALAGDMAVAIWNGDRSVGRVRRDFRDGQMQLAVALAAQVLFSFVLIWVLLEQHVFKPLLRLREPADRRDEIGPLAGSTTMRTDLQDQLEPLQVQAARQGGRSTHDSGAQPAQDDAHYGKHRAR